MYLSNKPYRTEEPKDFINRTKAAFRNKDGVELKTVQKELHNQPLKEARMKEKNNMLLLP